MSEWASNALGELVVFQKGRKVDTSSFPLAGYEAYLGAGALSGKFDGYGSKFLAVQADENDVLMLWDGERSGLTQMGLSGVVSSTVCKLSPIGEISSDLLYYFLLYNFEWIQNRRTGTGVPHVPKDIGRILRITYPRIKAEQQKIARILRTIDQAIEKTEALIDKYLQIKAGLMQDLFARGIGGNGKLRPAREDAPELYKETSIGWIPNEFTLVPVKNVFEIDSGITLGVHRRPRKQARPYLRVANVHTEELKMDDISYLEASDEECIRYGLKRFDILLVEGHANIQQIGRSAIVDCNAEGLLFQNHLFRLCSHVLSPYLGMYMLNSHFCRRYWETNCSTSSGLNTINRRMLGAMPIIIPEKIEQRRMEAVLLKASGRIEREKSFLFKLKEQKFGLMQDLLTGKSQVNAD